MSFPKSTLLALSLVGFTQLSAYAAPIQLMGEANIKNQTFQEAVVAMGQIKAKDSKFMQSLEGSGDTNIHESEMTDGTFSGKTELEEVKLSGSLKTSGNTKLDTVNVMGKTEFSGDTKVKKSTFGDTVTLSGEFEADGSTFKAIEAETDKMELENCKADSILIKTNKGSAQQQVLTLKGKTEITGSITFESGNGKVVIKDKSVKTGEIKGVSNPAPAEKKPEAPAKG